MEKKSRVFASIALCTVLALVYATLPVLSLAQDESSDDDIIFAGTCCQYGNQCPTQKCCKPGPMEANCSSKDPDKKNYCRRSCDNDSEPVEDFFAVN